MGLFQMIAIVVLIFMGVGMITEFKSEAVDIRVYMRRLGRLSSYVPPIPRRDQIRKVSLASLQRVSLGRL